MFFTYMFYDENGTVIYVGRSIDVKNRLQNFKKRTGVVPSRVEMFSFDTLEKSMADELERIDRFRPRHNIRRVSSRGSFGATYSEEERKRRSEWAKENNPGKTEEARRKASERMRELNRTNNPSRTDANRERLRQRMTNMNKTRKNIL